MMPGGMIPWLGGAVLAGCAAFDFAGRSTLLIGLLLVLPLLDRDWRVPPLIATPPQWRWLALVAGAGLLLVAWQPSQAGFAVSTLLFAAIPEEWFFRAYFMPRLGRGLRANAATSVLFALLHGLVWGWPVGLQVFLPSLAFGWLYQRTGNLALVILVHALSNIFYVTVVPYLTELAGIAQT